MSKTVTQTVTETKAQDLSSRHNKEQLALQAELMLASNAPRVPVACFAPPLTDALLQKYEKMISDLPREMGEVKDIMKECLAPVKMWWELPESKRRDGVDFVFNIGGKGDKTIACTPLELKHQEDLFDLIPWPRELKTMGEVLDQLPSNTSEQKELRDAAYHLLWYANELCRDREPLTKDVL